MVSSLPAATERGVRFEFEVECRGRRGLPRRVLLSWYRTPLADEDARAARRRGASRASAGCSPCGCAGRTATEPARLRLRGLAPRARHRRHRLRAQRGAQRAARPARQPRGPHRAGARGGARPLQARARRDAGGGHPRRARGRRPARHLARGVAPVQPHRRHAPDEHLRPARDAGLGPAARGWSRRLWRRVAARSRCACRRARPARWRRSRRRSATRCSPASRCRRSAPSTW